MKRSKTKAVHCRLLTPKKAKKRLCKCKPDYCFGAFLMAYEEVMK